MDPDSMPLLCVLAGPDPDATEPVDGRRYGPRDVLAAGDVRREAES